MRTRFPRRLLALVALVGLFGCKSDPAPSGSPAASGAPAGSAAAGDPVDACVAVLRTEATSTEHATRAGKMARGCAALYKDPACRDAHLHYEDQEPAKQAITLTRACAEAYCARLPDPKPKLCTADSAHAADLANLWWELRVAIWKLDLGEKEASRLEKEMLQVAAQAQQRGPR